MATFPQWEYDLLKALGAPASQNNLTALNLWAQSEGSVTNNPLATSGKGAGATTCVAQCGSTSPIYEYATEADGVAQMAGFLKGSYYTAIVRAFVQDVGLAGIYQAINNSPWCKGCQSGQYPVDLSKEVGGASLTSISTTVGSDAAAGQSGSDAGSSLSTCVIQFPGLLFFSGPCLLTKGGVKWVSAAVCIVAGVAITGFGVVLLASAVGQSTGATDAVKKGAKTVGIGASLLAGQPEVAGGIAAATKGNGAKAPTRAAAPVPRTPRLTPVELQQRQESQRTARDIAATLRPNNRGLSRERTQARVPLNLSRETTFKQQKAAGDAKARAMNF